MFVAGAVMLWAGVTGSAQAQFTCPTKIQWTYSNPSINIPHVFCGEIEGNKAKGFHSRPGGINPGSVADVKITQPPNASGVYGGIVTLVNPDGPNLSKFSTIFPDTCNLLEVVRSILHAYENQVACPTGAPQWASCGFNRPEDGSETGTEYCVGPSEDARFYIAFATLSHGEYAGKINTAFPLY
ncbi:EndoU domain-containing protein [Thalassospira profundimaris]|uniref:EndoU domain-containing protein n=1 Tax=Thalassospira profundimaris TaxID=502049 RepID=UPI0006873DBF|nr:EndoU domain-containing protein [Thalassospira profundimaris]